ncbi:MAG: hypothetical protein LBR80_10295 [Deltaproteobacteria bacterium]|nr:hypothetical protein [Deltaproteobacteria bacterium]
MVLPDISTLEKAQAWIGHDMPSLHAAREQFVEIVLPSGSSKPAMPDASDSLTFFAEDAWKSSASWLRPRAPSASQLRPALRPLLGFRPASPSGEGPVS